MFLFNIDKIDRSMIGVLTQFAIYKIIGIVVVIIIQILTNHKKKKFGFTLWDCILSGPFEECVFRGLPMWIFGVNGGIVGTVIWAVVHGSVTRFIYCIIIGIFYLRMWISGMWIEAIVIHSIWNIICYAFSKSEETPQPKEGVDG